VISTGEAARGPWSRALRTPIERVLPLGTPRTDFFFDADAQAAARARILAAHPGLEGRRVVLYAPTLRGRGREKRIATNLDAPRLRAALNTGDRLVLKSHPNVDPAFVPEAGFDVVANPAAEINDWLVVADVLITDYSSSIFEFALLRRPIVLLVPDLEAYEADPGLYLDYRTELVGTLARDTDAVIAAVLASSTAGPPDYESFIARHLGGCDGHASERFVDHFLPAGSAA
jgi:CDP-glycerol glycerophosphotransferase (TagB/SpsB family)